LESFTVPFVLFSFCRNRLVKKIEWINDFHTKLLQSTRKINCFNFCTIMATFKGRKSFHN
jgi:hypothetical protein